MSVADVQFGRRVLREEIKSYLIDAILRGDIQPGERIVETRIAHQLGVSQAPVREAIRDLESLGLVESMPFRGASVRQLSLTDLAEIYPVRAAIEGVAARLATTRISAEDLRRLEDLNQAMIEAAQRSDIPAYTRSNIEFHQIIVTASENSALVRIWKSLQLAAWASATVVRPEHMLIEMTAQHDQVIQALRNDDSERAELALRHHIEEVGVWVRRRAEQPT